MSFREYSNKANPNIADNDQDTPLISCSWKNQSIIIQLLVKFSSIDIMKKNKENKTAIHYSIENGLSKQDIFFLYNINLEDEYIDIEPDSTCLICYQPILEQEISYCNHCNNVFCKECLINWFKIDNLYVKKCAYCKNNWIQDIKFYYKRIHNNIDNNTDNNIDTNTDNNVDTTNNRRISYNRLNQNVLNFLRRLN